MTELPAPFGKYTLTEHLATGGMATLMLATLRGPLGFEKQVVIKQIHPRLSDKPAFVDMFAAEARTLVALNHGNIVPVYELGMVDDTYFIAMEYVDGPTLYRLQAALTAAGERLPPRLAAWIAAEILAGLDHAHRRGVGVIHRDLSPRNVMLSRDGEVKLVDFGIAVTLGTNADTAEGDPTGSFPYMSPEQVARAPLTPQSDLFAVGVLLWEMLTGQRLFARDDAAATLAAVAGAPVLAPSTIVGDAVAPFDGVVTRALSRDLAHRWATAADFRAALSRILYADDAPPGARELAPIIGRYAPPHRRRATTASAPSTRSPAGPDIPEGPTTAVMPRGKPPRAKTFATNVALAAELDAAPPEPAAPAPPPVAEPAPPPARRRGPLVAAIAGLALAAVAAIWLLRRDAAPAAPTPSPGSAAGGVTVDARPAPGLDARRPDARTADAALAPQAPADARVAPRVDARPTPRPDARPAAPATDAAVEPAVLKIGAAPWGEVTVDGVAHGRTPATVSVPPGTHTIDVVFPASTPPGRETFRVTLTPGEQRSVFAEFTAPR